ncbi:MAG: hypothetical protein ABI217_03400 [Chthoniobacterales bacterium]
MKNSSSLNAHQYAARFGKAALHPLCQAGLMFWDEDEKLAEETKKLTESREILIALYQTRRDAARLFDYFRGAHMTREAQDAANIMRKLDNELLQKAWKRHEAQAGLQSFAVKGRTITHARFQAELSAADAKARRALPRVKKRWDAKTKEKKPGDRRKLGMLNMVRDKTIKGAWAKGGAVDGYAEAAFGGNRPLSDETWQGRITAREAYSLLSVTAPEAAGDTEAKEIRLAAKQLGLRLAKDDPGRKEKLPHLKKQSPKRPRGRPREHEHAELVYNADISTAEANFIKKYLPSPVNTMENPSKQGAFYAAPQMDKTTGIQVWIGESARKVFGEIDREIRRLTLIRGGRKGLYVY